jgi:beta-carotene hydroxylase
LTTVIKVSSVTIQIERRAERQATKPLIGKFAWRVVLEFLVSVTLWVAILAMGLNGAIPLWLGLLLNTVVASSFYMPLHESVHGNVWGRQRRGRAGERIIGTICSIPLALDFTAHRISHMQHHAFTNDPKKDPDHLSSGPLRELPVGWYGLMLSKIIYPALIFVPASRRLLPKKLTQGGALEVDATDPGVVREGKSSLRYWVLQHTVLLAAIVLGVGLEALLLWYLPSLLALGWLLLVFAWYPHHPATEVGRYVDTRVAVFPGSTLLIRGHDYHALHHLFPRVPHYHLPKLWKEIGEDLTAKGVRTEGRAKGATGPVIW